MYQYDLDWDLVGYVNYTLAVSPYDGWLDRGKRLCRYRAFRDPQGHYTISHWKIIGLKLSFVIIFEHLVFGICRLIDLVVPDIPESLDIKIKRERFLAKEALQEADHVLQVRDMRDDLILFNVYEHEDACFVIKITESVMVFLCGLLTV